MNTHPASQPLAEIPAPVLAAQLDLPSAWQRVSARAGMPGVDGIAVRRFERCAKTALRTLESRFARDECRPWPLRLAEVEKKNGSRRLLLVPCVADRVAMTAAAQWLGAKWNPRFDRASFAYRPGLGVADALEALAVLRDHGYRWILDADIRSFFDSISHDLLLRQLEHFLGAASPMLNWVRGWVSATVWDGEALGLLEHGVPQGSPLSPLLANYFLDPFDRALRRHGFEWIRYADDFLVLARTPFELSTIHAAVAAELGRLGLELSAEKTRHTSFDKGFRFLGAEIRGDSMLQPFARRKTARKPVYVAPPMPPALLRAFRSGTWKPTGPFCWRPSNRLAEAPSTARPAMDRSPLLESLRVRPR